MTRRSLITAAVCFVAVLVASLAYVSLRLGVIHTGYAIAEQSGERRALEEENRKLRVEEALLRNPERIERLAREKLGMVRPDPQRIRVVKPDSGELAAAR
jgi:cell division protein FtsL